MCITMSRFLIFVAALSIDQVAFVFADYQCLCNIYNVELTVYAKPSSDSQVMGYLYKFDCKPVYGNVAKDSRFQSVHYEHQVGYAEISSYVQIQICRGTVPDDDKVTTTTPVTTQSMSTSTSQPTQTDCSTLPTITTTPITTPITTTAAPTTPTTTTTTAPTTTTTKQAQKPSCPAGWVMYSMSCYLFQTSYRRHWNEANGDCVNRKSHLAIIETADEHNFLKQELGHRINTHDDDVSDTSAWVSGRDNNREGTWEWYDGFTNTYKPFTYTHWGHDEPNAGDHEHEEDCMAMVGNHHFKWADYSCNENMFYVCERSAFASIAPIVG